MKDRDKTKEQLASELGELRKQSKEQEDKLKAANQQLDTQNQQLQASEQQLRAVNQQLEANNQQLRAREKEVNVAYDSLNSSVSGVIITNQEGEITYCNPAFLQMFEYKNRDEVTGKYAADLFTTEKVQKFTDVAAIIDQTKGETEEFPARRKDGTEFPVEVISSNVTDQEGNNVGRMASFSDITERKQAEEEIIKQSNFLNNVMESLTHPFYVIDANDYSILQANTASGYIPGSKTTCHALTHNSKLPCNTQDHSCPLEIVKKTGKPVMLEHIHFDKDGNEINVEVHGFPVIDENGEITSMIEYSLDITKRKQAERNLERAFSGTIEVISKIQGLRDAYTAGHQRRVNQLALEIAHKLNLSEEKEQGLEVASRIHDIGKVVIPAEILSKPTKLTELEYSYIKQHPTVAYKVLKDMDFPWPFDEIIYQHHERLDGSGYPRGLKEDEIMLEAKILAVADVVESISSHRPYRPALSTDVTKDEIINNKGKLYDAEVVDACLEILNSGFEFMEIEDTVLEKKG